MLMPALPPQLHAGRVLGRAELELAQVLVLDVVEHVLVRGEGRSLALQLEDDHAAVVP